MKITYSILSVLFVAMFVLTSCHIEDNPVASTPVNGDEPIEFSSVYASVDTKTTTGENSALPANFQVWASKTVNSNTNYNVFGENGTTVTNTGSADSPKWTYSPVRYWQSGEYNFVAVTPVTLATGELTEDGLELSFGSWTLSSGIDALFATSDASNEVVSLTFKHLLSKISFSAKNATSTPIEITSVKISGHHNEAESLVLSEEAAVWEFKDDGNASQDITSSASDSYELSSTATKVTSDVLVFSEDCSLTVEVTIRHAAVAAGYPKSATISTTGWLPGMQYDYVINVTPDGISFSEPRVEGWDYVDDNDNGYTADDGIDF